MAQQATSLLKDSRSPFASLSYWGRSDSYLSEFEWPDFDLELTARALENERRTIERVAGTK